MNNEEIQSLIKQLKAAGLNDEEIMDTFYEAFTDGKMDRKDLEALAEALGYELTDEFKNDAQPDPIASNEGGEGATKEDLEAAKEIKPGETEEEFKEKIEGSNPVENGEDDKTAPADENKSDNKPEDKPEENNDGEDKGEDNDEEDWDKAQKLFKI